MNQHMNTPPGAKTAAEAARVCVCVCVCVRARELPTEPLELSDPPSALHPVSRYLPLSHRICQRRADALLPSNRLHQVQE